MIPLDKPAAPADGRLVLFELGRLSPAFLAAVAACVVVGCGDGLPKRVPVSGTVLVDGEPLVYGRVMFVPEGMRPSAAEVDQEGRFTLRCFDGEDGAVLGMHRVQVSASDLRGPRPIWHAPRKYADFRTSGLTQEITEAADDVVIELTWEGEKRPRR